MCLSRKGLGNRCKVMHEAIFRHKNVMLYNCIEGVLTEAVQLWFRMGLEMGEWHSELCNRQSPALECVCNFQDTPHADGEPLALYSTKWGAELFSGGTKSLLEP